MTNQAIYDTPEYKLAPRDMQGWAFTHKDQYISAEDAAKRMGVKLDNLSAKIMVTVKDKTGTNVEKTEEREIPLVSHFYSVTPNQKFKRVHLRINGKQVTYFMVKGAKPDSKNAEYFTYDDFMASPDTKKIIDTIDSASKAFRKKHNEMVKAELAKSHPPAAKKAAKELPALANEEDAVQKVYDWFLKNGYDMPHVKPSDLKSFVADMKKTGHISSQFHVSSRADGHGHQTGTAGTIDFAKKAIGLYGWSSDD